MTTRSNKAESTLSPKSTFKSETRGKKKTDTENGVVLVHYSDMSSKCQYGL
jgi:hypothetical protein